ncbi:MAG: hypothetical protein KKA81_16175, partial [Bacteroidetes bacterium]|nr:hypothetical protein [Bacteroidota bacterium]
DSGTFWRPCKVTGGVWEYPGNCGDSVPPFTDGLYRIEVRAQDGALNYESTITTITISYDTQVPTTSIKMPCFGWHKSYATISGTAQDPGNAGIEKVEVAIRDNTLVPPKYWSGSSFNSVDIVWSTTTLSDIGGGKWQFTYPIPGQSIPNWGSGGTQSADGDQIEVRSQVTDKSGNQESPYQSWTFYVDITTPTVNILSPAVNVSTISTLTTISGSAADTPSYPAGQIKNVKIRIYRLLDEKYWGGITFSIAKVNADDAWFVPASTNSAGTVWSHPFNSGDWNNGYLYRIEAKVDDRADNYQTGYSTREFRIDYSPPVSKVDLPVHSSVISQFSKITGTAADTGGLKSVNISVVRLDTNKYWESAVQTWNQNTTYWIEVNPPWTSWDFTQIEQSHLTNGVSYWVTTISTDVSQPPLVEVPSSARGSYFIYDTTPPVSNIRAPVDISTVSIKSYSSIQIASGNCSDFQPFSGAAYSNSISSVEISIQNLTLNNTWWTGSGWAESETWRPASNFVVGNDSWTYTSIADAFNSGWQYKFKTRGYDGALPNNIQTVFNEYTVTYDTHPPTSSLQLPTSVNPNYGLDRILSTISGSSDDDLSSPYKAGVLKVQVRISTGTPAIYWNEVNWTGTSASWLDTDTPETDPFVFTSTPMWLNGKEYTVETRATDKVIPSGNLQIAYSTVTFKY